MNTKYKRAKDALERGYLNVKVGKVIESCKTKEQLRIAEEYMNRVLIRLYDLFQDDAVDQGQAIQGYLHLKNHYTGLIQETEYKIYKKGVC